MVSERALGALVRGTGLARALAQALDPLELVRDSLKGAFASGAVAPCLLGVVADDQPPSGLALADAHLLDAQVVSDLAVAARARERGLDCGLARAHALAGDPVAAAAAQVAQVVLLSTSEASARGSASWRASRGLSSSA